MRYAKRVAVIAAAVAVAVVLVAVAASTVVAMLTPLMHWLG